MDLRGRRKICNEKFHKLYAIPNIVRVIKSRRMRHAGYLACMEETRNVYKILVRKAERITRKT